MLARSWSSGSGGVVSSAFGSAPSYDQLVALVGAKDARIAVLGAQLDAALVRGDDLEQRVAALEAQVRRSSRNSSKPPSSQGYDKPAPRSLRRPSGRSRGGQDGHDGAGLAQVAAPDEVVVHAPPACAGCGASLLGAPVVSIESRQVFDVAPVALSVVEHRLQHRRCACGITTMARAPARCTRAPAQYGPGVRAVAVYLVSAQHLPYARAAQVMSDLLGAPVSAGSIAAWVADAGRALAAPGSFMAAVTAALGGAPVVHADETGLRVDGALAWIHSASTNDLTLYTCHDRRGVEAMNAAGVIGALPPAAVLVHDGWKPYATYEVVHALCNAHHLRELTAITENHRGQAPWAQSMIAFLVEVHHSAGRAKDAGAHCFAPELIATYQTRYAKIIEAGWAVNPDAPRPGAARPSGPRRRAGPAVALLTRLDVQREQVLRFATDFRVPFDNNLAERDIRMVKLRQKISGCLRTHAGATTFAALRSYLSTTAKQHIPAIDALRHLTNGHPWLPTPEST